MSTTARQRSPALPGATLGQALETDLPQDPDRLLATAWEAMAEAQYRRKTLGVPFTEGRQLISLITAWCALGNLLGMHLEDVPRMSPG